MDRDIFLWCDPARGCAGFSPVIYGFFFSGGGREGGGANGVGFANARPQCPSSACRYSVSASIMGDEQNSCPMVSGGVRAFTMAFKSLSALTIGAHNGSLFPTCYLLVRCPGNHLPDLALLPVILPDQRHDFPHLSPGSTNAQALGISCGLGFSGFGHWSGALFPRSPLPDHLGLSCSALRCPAVRYAHG